MNIAAVGSNNSQSIGSLLLQELNAAGTNTQNPTDLSSILGDLVTLSPAAQQLTKAPDAVTQAMSDLFSGQTDVQGDVAQLKSYFKQNPQSLASVLNSLQGTTATYSASTSLDPSAALLTALMNKQSNNSDPSALLSLLSATQGQPSLFSILASSGGSASNSPSIFG
jgi:lipopolysaccharide biosynthesis regulator YciM